MIPGKSDRSEYRRTSSFWKKTRLFRALGIAVGLCISSGATAQTTGSNWQFTVAPYFWGAGISGTSGTLPGVPPAEFDLSFKDILENLDGSGMISGNARNGRFGISTDFQYVRTVSDGETPGPLFGPTRMESTSTIFSITGEYLLSDNPTSELWVAAGLRYWDVETELSLGAGTLPARTSTGRNKWWDPVIGLRGRADLGQKTFFTGWAYLGGFGVGSESMSDVFAGLGYQFTDVTSGIIGWRHISVDRRDDSFVYDIKQSGPVLGLTFRF